jgi:SAM-dependent methyltransferase
MPESRPAFTESERRQQRHYDRVAGDYALHAGDPCTMRYRERFIEGALFAGTDLGGKRVLEAMCGPGGTTRYLLGHGAIVTGLDISRNALDLFTRNWPECEAIAGSILDTTIPPSSFDYVVAVGGLHHLHPHLDRAIDEIHRLLKPGGLFCFTDPHADSLFERLRQIWYRLDPMFEKNEAGIDVTRMMAVNRDRFEFVKVEYLGSLAYLLVLNSLVFRMPYFLKRLYSPALMALEAWLNPLLGRRTAMYVVSQWRKR